MEREEQEAGFREHCKKGFEDEVWQGSGEEQYKEEGENGKGGAERRGMARESDRCLPLRMYQVLQIDRRVRSQIDDLYGSDRNWSLLHAVWPLPRQRCSLDGPSERTVKN